MTSLNPLHPIEKQISEVLKLHQGMGDKAARQRTLALLEEVGIREPEKRMNAYPHQLSGGQRQRVMIAMALANKPKLLIADEPTTALDVTVQAQILKLLAELKAAQGMSMLFITHDLGIVRKIADRVCVMTGGKIVETGPTKQIFDNPQHEYTKHLLAAEPKGNPPSADLSAEPVMRGENLKVWFPIKQGFLRKTVDYVKAVDGIDVTIRAGQTLGVVGESGSGKTTLGLALSRMISSEGVIRFGTKDINQYSFKQMRPLRRELQIVFQDPYGSLSHACRLPTLLPKVCRFTSRNFQWVSGMRASSQRLKKSISIRKTVSVTRTSSPVANVNASQSHAPWCSTRVSSCWTSLRPR